MTGSYWRLLTGFSLIFIVPMLLAPGLLRAQDVVADRSEAPTLALSPRAAPILPGQLPLLPTVPSHYPLPPGTIALQQIVRTAGIIFAGRVTSVGRAIPSSGLSSSATAVTFQVDHGIRGAASGQSLTIHEWSGLWASGERYRVGERVLLFLYSPGRLGLSSPVGRAMGRFAIDPRDRIIMSAQHAAVLASDPILGGKTLVPYVDFAQAVRLAGGGE